MIKGPQTYSVRRVFFFASFRTQYLSLTYFRFNFILLEILYKEDSTPSFYKTDIVVLLMGGLRDNESIQLEK